MAGGMPTFRQFKKVMNIIPKVPPEALDTIGLFMYAYNMSRTETKRLLESGGFYISNKQVTENRNPHLFIDEQGEIHYVTIPTNTKKL